MKGKRKKIDLRINKIIVETCAVLVGVFITIGLVMSQIFEEGSTRFYELLGWSISLTIPFILASMISVVVIAYYREIETNHPKLLIGLKQVSIITYIFAWTALLFRAYQFSPEYFIGNIQWYLTFGYFFIIVLLLLIIIWLRGRKVQPTLELYS